MIIDERKKRGTREVFTGKIKILEIGRPGGGGNIILYKIHTPG